MNHRVPENLLADLPCQLPDEWVSVLVDGENMRVERIVSTGHSSPQGFWYDQAEAEWVMVLKGEAKLRFEDDAELVWMRPGDHVLISPHRKHRVEWTSPDETTVWLAVFYSGSKHQRTDVSDDGSRAV